MGMGGGGGLDGTVSLGGGGLRSLARIFSPALAPKSIYILYMKLFYLCFFWISIISSSFVIIYFQLVQYLTKLDPDDLRPLTLPFRCSRLLHLCSWFTLSSSVASFLVLGGGGGQDPKCTDRKKLHVHVIDMCERAKRASASETYMFSSLKIHQCMAL